LTLVVVEDDDSVRFSYLCIIYTLTLTSVEWWGAGVVICLDRGADLHMARLMPLPLTVSCFSKIQMVLPFWYRPTLVVPENGVVKRVCVCVCVCDIVQVCHQFVK